MFVNVATSTVGAVAGAAGRGGILVNYGDELDKGFVKSIYHRDGIMSAVLKSGDTINIALSRSEMNELKDIVEADFDKSLEISIDPVADQQIGYLSPELSDTKVGKKLLELDSYLAVLLEGGYKIDTSILGAAQLPANIVRRYLGKQSGDQKYQHLIKEYVFPVLNRHSSVITVSVNNSGGLALRIDMDPTPVFTTPDGRYLFPTKKVKQIAAKPYMPLVNKLEESPELFFGVVPNLDEGFRYAKAYALLSAYKSSHSYKWKQRIAVESSLLDDLYDSDGEEDLSTLIKTTISELNAAGRNGQVQMLWRNYRLGLNPKEFTENQRVLLFVNEVMARYRDLDAASSLSLLSPMEPEEVDKIVENIDIAKTDKEYLGWFYLAKFVSGVWKGDQLVELDQHLAHAHTQARETANKLLEYHIVKAAQGLMPVIESNNFIRQTAQNGSQSEEIITPLTFGWLNVQPAKMIDSEAYFTQLEAHLNEELNRVVRQNFEFISQKASELITPTGKLTGNKRKVLTVLADFELYHLASESGRLPANQVYKTLGQLHYVIGLSAVKTHNRQEVLNRARILESIAVKADQEYNTEASAQLYDWVNELRESVE